MTITFRGHVEVMNDHGAEVELTVRTPMDPTNGGAFVVRVPKGQAQHWLPGRVVDFRLYALDPSLAPDVGVARNSEASSKPQSTSNGGATDEP